MPDSSPEVGTLEFRVVGMDCARDAAEIEQAVSSLTGVRHARVSTASHRLTLQSAVPGLAPRVEETVSALGYGLEPVAPLEGEATHRSAAYARALIVVAALNLGFGVVEMAGGAWADSQALKADALDFLGDGLITLLAVAAIAWSARWRARAALAQGIFLALLGLGVLGQTIYRTLVQAVPEAEVMGVLGVAALLVNVGAAALLARHRSGDANVRAVWLFSRNDAIGNAAVVAASLLVGWTGSPWPDLAVAAAVALLFLASARVIIRDSLAEIGSD